MENSIMGFFDQRHFNQECKCLAGENQVNNNCPVHAMQEKSPDERRFGKQEVEPVEINQSFPRQPTTEFLVGLIEYRIKILSVADLKFRPGEGGKVNTNTTIARKAGKLSMLMKPAENLPLRFVSEGLISPFFRGPLTVELHNSSDENVHVRAGSLIAYMVMTPFME